MAKGSNPAPLSNETPAGKVPATISSRALAANTPATANIGGKVYAIKRQVILPLLKQEVGEAVAVKITAPYFVGKALKVKGDEKPMEPATLVNVTDLADGKPKQFIVNAVLKGVLDDQYADNSYIGVCFSIMKTPSPKGKRYKGFEVFEIEPTGDDAPAEAVAETAAA